MFSAFPVLKADVVVFVSRYSENRKDRLTKEEACQLLLGPNLVQRDEKSGTREWVENQGGGKKNENPLMVVEDGTTKVFEAIEAEVKRGNKAAIGYGTPTQGQSMVQAIPVDWPQQEFYAVVRKDGPSYLKEEVVPFIRQVLRKG